MATNPICVHAGTAWAPLPKHLKLERLFFDRPVVNQIMGIVRVPLEFLIVELRCFRNRRTGKTPVAAEIPVGPAAASDPNPTRRTPDAFWFWIKFPEHLNALCLGSLPSSRGPNVSTDPLFWLRHNTISSTISITRKISQRSHDTTILLFLNLILRREAKRSLEGRMACTGASLEAPLRIHIGCSRCEHLKGQTREHPCLMRLRMGSAGFKPLKQLAKFVSSSLVQILLRRPGREFV